MMLVASKLHYSLSYVISCAASLLAMVPVPAFIDDTVIGMQHLTSFLSHFVNQTACKASIYTLSSRTVVEW